MNVNPFSNETFFFFFNQTEYLSFIFCWTAEHWNLMMYYSPVVLLLKVADRYEASSTSQGKLVLQWRPLDTGGCTVDSHQDKGGLPHTILQRPNVSVAVRSTSDNAVGLRGPVNTCGDNYEYLMFKCQWTTGHCKARHIIILLEIKSFNNLLYSEFRQLWLPRSKV